MNAKVHITVPVQTRLQQFLAQYNRRIVRPVIDQTAPRSTYQPEYIAHRNVTMRRTGGAK